ncbi:MAG: ThiF family adenylyltransferase, partial [Nanoarchaeota archaeon]|nr:ThiF family adenylyltransferase [Nanoarchaeota archaeon]
VKKAKVLVAGAGAIGNYAALNLALSGFMRIDILDFDSVAYHNLSRQILLYGKVGENKAEVLSERIREISGCKSKHHNLKLSSSSRGFLEKSNYDLIMGCFDNEMARYELSNLALELEIPYIDGGVSPLSGNLSVYYPGKTACMKCKKSLKPTEVKVSCQDAPNPSVVIPNIIIGSMMAGEAHHAVSGRPLERRLVFDSEYEKRIYVTSDSVSMDDCSCGRRNGNR